MSTTEAGDPNNYPASITIPSDGDTLDAASVNPAFGGLADRTAQLHASLAPLGDISALANLPSGGPPMRFVPGFGWFTDVIAVGLGAIFTNATNTPLAPWVVDGIAGQKWVHESLCSRFGIRDYAAGFFSLMRYVDANDPVGVSPELAQSNNVPLTGPATHVSRFLRGLNFQIVQSGLNLNSAHAVWCLDRHLVDAAHLINTHVTIEPASGHVGLPIVLPKIWIQRRAHGSATLDPINGAGGTTDPSGSVAVYDTMHTILCPSAANNRIDLNSYTYSLVLSNEAGGPSLVGLAVHDLKLEFQL